MATFAKLRDPQLGYTIVECVHNREVEEHLKSELLFHVLSDEVAERYGIDPQFGEILIYNPSFRPDLSCAWVAYSIDFDFYEY